MKGKTHSNGEMIRILRQADGGETAQSVCRAHNISEQTFYHEIAHTLFPDFQNNVLYQRSARSLCASRKANWNSFAISPRPNS